MGIRITPRAAIIASRQLKHVGLTMQMAIVCRKIKHARQMPACVGNKGPIMDRSIKRVKMVLGCYFSISNFSFSRFAQ